MKWSDIGRFWVQPLSAKKYKLCETVIISKLFLCIGIAIPVLHRLLGEYAEIVVNEVVGPCFEPEQLGELVSRIRILAHDRYPHQ